MLTVEGLAEVRTHEHQIQELLGGECDDASSREAPREWRGSWILQDEPRKQQEAGQIENRPKTIFF